MDKRNYKCARCNVNCGGGAFVGAHKVCLSCFNIAHNLWSEIVGLTDTLKKAEKHNEKFIEEVKSGTNN